jgi:hypothetical protein
MHKVYNVYFRPISCNFVLVDDLSTDAFDAMFCDGIRPAAIVETSNHSGAPTLPPSVLILASSRIYGCTLYIMRVLSCANPSSHRASNLCGKYVPAELRVKLRRVNTVTATFQSRLFLVQSLGGPRPKLPVGRLHPEARL